MNMSFHFSLAIRSYNTLHGTEGNNLVHNRTVSGVKGQLKVHVPCTWHPSPCMCMCIRGMLVHVRVRGGGHMTWGEMDWEGWGGLWHKKRRNGMQHLSIIF